MANLSRRIHLIRTPKGVNYSNPLNLNGRGIDALEGLTEFVRENGAHKFSRRKFKGAKKVVFKADEDHWFNGFDSIPVFCASLNGRSIDVCGRYAHTYFGVTKDTKRVAIWYKKVTA